MEAEGYEIVQEESDPQSVSHQIRPPSCRLLSRWGLSVYLTRGGALGSGPLKVIHLNLSEKGQNPGEAFLYSSTFQ